MRRLATLVAGFCVAMTLGWTSTGCSTEALCDEACEYWTSCTQVAGNTLNYSWDECISDCESDGDWSRSYVNCLSEQTTCPALGNQC